MVLTFEGLTRKYSGQYALNDVNATLQAGDSCLLLGPNGSGKTTLMKILTGLVQPSSGRVLLDGKPLCVKDKARIAYMPTENYFYNYMTIKDAGKYYRDFFKDFDYQAYEKCINRADMSLNASIRALSSGMSAKLRLALILSRDAELMMFDEPINGVDLLTRDWVLHEIGVKRTEGRILLMSTHLFEQAEDKANCALFLKHGKLVKSGRLTEICAQDNLEDIYRAVYGNKEDESNA